MINIKNNFNNASDAYNYFYTKIATEGFEFDDRIFIDLPSKY